MARKYQHTEEFYKKQYDKYLHSLSAGTVSGFENYHSFRAKYKSLEIKGRKEILKDLVYQTEYEIDWTTYKAERDFMRSIGKTVSKKKILNQTTREWASEHKEYINDFRKDLFSAGSDKDKVAEAVSQNFFGSD